MQNSTVNTADRSGTKLERIFNVVAGGLLVLVGLVFLVQIGIIVWLPARMYEATATFALYPNAPNNAQDGLQTAWSILPPDASVGLELVQGEPHVYHLLYRSSDPAQAAKQANAVAVATEANAVRTGAGRFQLLHPADVPVKWTSPRNRQLQSSLLLLLLALIPVVSGFRLLFRRPIPSPDALPT